MSGHKVATFNFMKKEERREKMELYFVGVGGGMCVGMGVNINLCLKARLPFAADAA